MSLDSVNQLHRKPEQLVSMAATVYLLHSTDPLLHRALESSKSIFSQVLNLKIKLRRGRCCNCSLAIIGTQQPLPFPHSKFPSPSTMNLVACLVAMISKFASLNTHVLKS